MNRIILEVVLLCSQVNHQLTKPQCLAIYDKQARIIESLLPVDLRLTRTLYKRRLWSTNPLDKQQLAINADNFFRQRDYSNYDMHMAIFSKDPSEGAFGIFRDFGHYCEKSTALITANNTYFSAYLPTYALLLSHEAAHLIGASHDSVAGSIMSTSYSRTDNPFFSELSKNQINACLATWK